MKRKPLYQTRICKRCDGVYLYPAYGGYGYCNTCRIEMGTL